MSIVTNVARWKSNKEGIGGEAGGSDSLDDLTRYIPTETITLFVASMGVLSVLSKLWTPITALVLYVIWGAITPIVVFLVALGRHKSNGAGGPLAFPTWPATSATIAFLAWGLAVPGMVDDDSKKILAAFGALVVSKALSLCEPIFKART